MNDKYTGPATIEVEIIRNGTVVDRIVRPVRDLGGRPAVTYRRQLWPVVNGRILIDVAEPPPAVHASAGPGPLPARADFPGDDDSLERESIVTAPASVRMLVEAGPGTGKTEIAARRLAQLISTGTSPAQILVLSFSRSAVRTLTSRISRVSDPSLPVLEELRHVSIRTFDSWAFRILRLMGQSPGQLLSGSHDQNIRQLTTLIGGEQRERVREMIGNRRHLIVDEFQDLPGVRGDLVLALLDLLCPPHEDSCGFTILGDPAQAIYGFAARGSGSMVSPTPVEYWNRVLTTYGEGLFRFALRRNYRAGEELARLSSALRGVLLSELSEAAKLEAVRQSLGGLATGSAPIGPAWLDHLKSGSQAILTQTNGEAVRVLQKLLGTDVKGPGERVQLRAGNGEALPPAWIAGLLRRMREETVTRSRFSRVYEFLRSEWSEATCARLGLPDEDTAWKRMAFASGQPQDATSFSLADLRDRMSWPDAFPDDQFPGDEGIVVTTIHQSKGLEFDIVSILDSDDTRTSEDPAEILEKASVGFVGLSRAGQSVSRVPRNEIFTPPGQWDCSRGRTRLRHWYGAWVNLEMGLRGDVDPAGFVDPTLLGGVDGVAEVQNLLLTEASGLVGHKVMLKKQLEEASGKVVWKIHLQTGNEPGQLIGRTGEQLTRDLLSLLHDKGYSLPPTIMNLRISGVGTLTADTGFDLEGPEQKSRLWLGVSLFGTGDFRPLRRSPG